MFDWEDPPGEFIDPWADEVDQQENSSLDGFIDPWASRTEKEEEEKKPRQGWGKIVDLYDRTLGDESPLALNKLIGPVENQPDYQALKYAGEKVGLPLEKIASAQRFGADILAGSPGAAIGTIGALASAGAGPIAAKAIPWISKISRGNDALFAARQSGKALEDVSEGNYGSALWYAGLGTLGFLGASTEIKPRPLNAAADNVPAKPAGLLPQSARPHPDWDWASITPDFSVKAEVPDITPKMPDLNPPSTIQSGRYAGKYRGEAPEKSYRVGVSSESYATRNPQVPEAEPLLPFSEIVPDIMTPAKPIYNGKQTFELPTAPESHQLPQRTFDAFTSDAFNVSKEAGAAKTKELIESVAKLDVDESKRLEALVEELNKAKLTPEQLVGAKDVLTERYGDQIAELAMEHVVAGEDPLGFIAGPTATQPKAVQTQSDRLATLENVVNDQPDGLTLPTGERSILQAPEPKLSVLEVTVDDVRQALAARGLIDPPDQLVARIRKDGALLRRMGLVADTQEGVVRPNTNLLPEHTTKLPEPSKLEQEAMEFTQPKLPGLTQQQYPKDFSEAIPRDIRTVPEETLQYLSGSLDVPKEIAIAADQARQAFNQHKERSFLSQFQGIYKSIETELSQMGENGARVAQLLNRVSTEAPSRFHELAKPMHELIDSITDKDWERIVRVAHGEIKSANPQDLKIVRQLSDYYTKLGVELERAGIFDRGAKSGYNLPLRYDRGKVTSSFLRERLRAKGLSEVRIDQIVQDFQKYGEKKIPAQLMRGKDILPGFRTDKNMVFEDLAEKAEKLTQAKYLGRLDLADPKSPISQMIKVTEDPDRAAQLVMAVLDRAPKGEAELGKKVSRAVQTWMAARYLSHFAISNIAGGVPVAMRAGVRNTLAEAKNALTNSVYQGKMNDFNLYQNLISGISGELAGDSKLLDKVFRFTQSQDYMARLAMLTGRKHAENLLTMLKKSPDDKLLRKQLSDLVSDDVSHLLAQEKLTEKQLDRAMWRFVEITQGVAGNKAKLPYEWSKEGITKLPQIFLRYSFQTTKGIVESVRQNPAKNLPKLLALGTILGEIIGDAKETVSTVGEWATSDDPEKADFGKLLQKNIADRRISWTRKTLIDLGADDLARNPYVVRAISNIMNSWVLGLPADLLESIATDENPARAIPAFDEILNTWGTLYEGAKEGSTTGIKREIVKTIPYFGRGAARNWPTIRQEKRAAAPPASGIVY
jgi:hypothetical protein